MAVRIAENQKIVADFRRLSTGVCRIVVTVLVNRLAGIVKDGVITWMFITVFILLGLEINLGIIAASLVTLRPLFSKFGQSSKQDRTDVPMLRMNEDHVEQQSLKSERWSGSSVLSGPRNGEEKDRSNTDPGPAVYQGAAANDVHEPRQEA